MQITWGRNLQNSGNSVWDSEVCFRSWFGCASNALCFAIRSPHPFQDPHNFWPDQARKCICAPKATARELSLGRMVCRALLEKARLWPGALLDRTATPPPAAGHSEPQTASKTDPPEINKMCVQLWLELEHHICIFMCIYWCLAHLLRTRKKLVSEPWKGKITDAKKVGTCHVWPCLWSPGLLHRDPRHILIAIWAPKGFVGFAKWSEAMKHKSFWPALVPLKSSIFKQWCI